MESGGQISVRLGMVGPWRINEGIRSDTRHGREVRTLAALTRKAYTLLPTRSQEPGTAPATELLLSPPIAELSQRNAAIPHTLRSQTETLRLRLYLQRLCTPAVTPTTLFHCREQNVTPLPTVTLT